MDLELSDSALAEYERLEADDPDRHALLVEDLSLMSRGGAEDVDLLAKLLGFTYYQGPTARVRYWITEERGRWVIEYFDID